jgi:hypothetical protein
MNQSELRFDGHTYNHSRDYKRLSSLLDDVKHLMSDGQWRTIPTICDTIGASSEASVSARLRDLRKPKFGGYIVERKFIGNGLWTYRVEERKG